MSSSVTGGALIWAAEQRSQKEGTILPYIHQTLSWIPVNNRGFPISWHTVVSWLLPYSILWYHSNWSLIPWRLVYRVWVCGIFVQQRMVYHESGKNLILKPCGSWGWTWRPHGPPARHTSIFISRFQSSKGLRDEWGIGDERMNRESLRQHPYIGGNLPRLQFIHM